MILEDTSGFQVLFLVSLFCACNGLTENAGPENAGPQKQDRKMEDKLPKAIT